jgi:UDP-N-acetylmuramate--alanine ligase
MTDLKKDIDINVVSRVHFIGIGGIGMSGLARYFLHERKEVSGSDYAPSIITDMLEREGVQFSPQQVASNITDDIDLVVYTEAMPQDHEELVAARKKEIPCVNYFEALGLVANPYYLIAVAGAHGKTTTTAMLVDVFEAAGLDPTAVIGSLRSKTKSNFRAGKSKYCIVEACEYRRDFLHLKPEILVITNIEEEHLDYYKDLADIQDAFRTLARSVPERGFIVANANDPKVAPALANVRAQIIDYTKLVNPLLYLKMPGMHNLLDAAAALGVAKALKIDERIAKRALEDFSGTWRRSEYLGETAGGALVYDDYGHHPTEIEATLKGFREKYPEKRMIVAFQPHLYSRTEDFFDRFVETLSIADEVVLAPIFEARRETNHDVSSEKLAMAIREKTGKKAEAFPNYEAIAEYLAKTVGANDLIITMGAGAINNVAEMLTGKKIIW